MKVDGNSSKLISFSDRMLENVIIPTIWPFFKPFHVLSMDIALGIDFFGGVCWMWIVGGEKTVVRLQEENRLCDDVGE